MKWLKKLGIVILALPIAIFVIWGLYEVFGMSVNHITAQKQTRTLQKNLEKEITDIEFIGVRSETGNLSGTGNHVDCLSAVVFATEMPKAEIEERMSKYYIYDGQVNLPVGMNGTDRHSEWGCLINETGDGYYTICVMTQAPFADNIEGH